MEATHTNERLIRMALTDQIHPLGQPIRTAGDLWKALHLGLQLTTETPGDAQQETILRQSIELLERYQQFKPQSRWSEVMRCLIGTCAITKNIDRASVVNLPLSDFVTLVRVKTPWSDPG